MMAVPKYMRVPWSDERVKINEANLLRLMKEVRATQEFVLALGEPAPAGKPIPFPSYTPNHPVERLYQFITDHIPERQYRYAQRISAVNPKGDRAYVRFMLSSYYAENSDLILDDSGTR